MALQVNVNDILSQLYQHRSVVEFLFANRENITVNELLSRDDFTHDHYQKLKSLDLLYEYENIVSLNDAVVAMFEDFMEIGEVTPGFINDYLNELHRHILPLERRVHLLRLADRHARIGARLAPGANRPVGAGRGCAPRGRTSRGSSPAAPARRGAPDASPARPSGSPR